MSRSVVFVGIILLGNARLLRAHRPALVVEASWVRWSPP